MISDEIEIRVRYGETDRMGYVHHGVYDLYFEEGRTELMRKHGLNYKELEDSGILLPLNYLTVKYNAPGLYDDVLVVRSEIREMPSVRLVFHYTITKKASGIKVCEGETGLVFVDATTRKPRRPPEEFVQKLKAYF